MLEEAKGNLTNTYCATYTIVFAFADPILRLTWHLSNYLQVDRLLSFINEVYLDGEIILDNKNKLKVVYKAPDQGATRRQTSPGGVQPSMFEWVEVNNARSTSTGSRSRRPQSRMESGRASAQKQRY